MKAVLIEAYGENDVVRYTDQPIPVPQKDEVLIKVAAAGVNPIDWKIRNGAGQRLGMNLPIILGGEISGTVNELGDEVNHLAIGDAVYGIVPTGGFAEYVTAKATDLVLKPKNLDFIQAAGIPLGGLTAYQALFDIAQLSAGQRVFITNGSGGVGSLAVQLAKARGAYVTAMASGRNEQFVKTLGADEFIDYTSTAFENLVSDLDVVFDTVGGDTFERALTCLKDDGCLVTSVAFPSDNTAQHNLHVERVFCKPNAHQLSQMAELAENGKLAAHISKTLPLAEIKHALDLSEAGHTRGKIVMVMGA